MKTRNKIIITIIAIIMMILLKNNISEAYSAQEITQMNSESVGQVVPILYRTEMNTLSNKTIYCISEGQHNGGNSVNYKVLTYIEIENGIATVWDQNHAEPMVSAENDSNRILAEILSGNHGDLGYGYADHTNNIENYTNTQKAIWLYLQTWIDTVGKNVGTDESWYVNNGYDDSKYGGVGTQVVNESTNAVAAGANPSVRIYLLNPDEVLDSWQRLMIAVPGNSPDDNGDENHQVSSEPTIVNANVNISGYVWEDIADSKNNTYDYIYNGDGSQDIKVSGIKVNWKSTNGELIASTTTDANGQYNLTTTITLQNHPYKEIDTAKYNLVNNSYIEFQYNGIKYTTVVEGRSITDSTTSKGIEDKLTRESLDNKFNRVEDEAVYDANNNLVASNLPNASLTNSNYLEGFNVTAATNGVISKLLYAAESNGWTRSTTFCTQHCKTLITNHTDSSCSICAQYKHLAHTATEVVRARGTTWGKDLNGDGDTKDKGETITGTGTDADNAAKEAAGWTIIDAGLEEVKILIYCNGEIEYTSKDNNKYVQYLTNAQKAQYTELIGDAYNSANGGLHYYSAEESYTTKKHCLSGEDHIIEWNIYNMNLGLVKREQPNGVLVSDIEKVRVIMKNQEYTYIYGNRGISDVDATVDYKLKWQNKYNAQTYSRPINPADIAYVNYNNSDELKVFVTYNIIAKNASNTLPMTINKIVTYYDNDYTIFNGQGTATSQGWTESGNFNSEYKTAYSTLLAGKTLAPGARSETITLEFEVSQEAIKGLLKEDSTLYTVSEIFSYSTMYGESTLCAESKTAADSLTSTGETKVGKQYAGIDKNSTPGNVVPGVESTYEDDDDKAPSFLLQQEKDKYKIMSGVVWEDHQTEESKDNNERLGDGIKNNEEKGVKNVRVELIKAETGETADLYYISDEGTAEKIPAITYTDENGNYKLGKDGEYGIVVDHYILKYTYGNDTNIIQNGIGTQLYGSETAIDARNYKSTIITDEVVQNLIKGNTLLDKYGNNVTDKWHIYMERENITSIAVDDLKERLNIPSLKYDNFDTPVNMSAYTRPFKLQIEYTEGEEKQMVDADGDGNIEGTVYKIDGNQTAVFETNVEEFNFGIVERPREDVVIEKTISKIKLTLERGTILIEGDPREEKLNYVKALGMYKAEPIRSRDQAKKASDKLLSMEVDSSLIQGSILEVWYEITVTNNSEYDYEYYADYTDIDQQSIFITKDSQANYYYYGDKEGIDLIDSTIEIVADYLDSEIVCEVGDQANQKIGDKEINNKDWSRYDNNGEQITVEKLKEKGYISEKTYEALKDGEYQVIVTDVFNGLKAGGNSKTSTIYTSKLLATQEESNIFENHTEILQLNSRIARTIEGVKDVRKTVDWHVENIREEIKKSYKPGNYIPSLAGRTINSDEVGLEIPGLHQPDDDRVRITITPPTGTTNYITMYIITAVIGLIVIVGGVIFIKKKILDK